MTSPHPTDLLAAHALGALDPDDDTRVQEHLARCADCRRALATLTPLPALLDLMTLDTEGDPAPVPAPASLETQVLRDFRPPPTERSDRRQTVGRRWWPAGGGVLAGSALTVAALALTGSLGGSATTDPATTVRLTSADTDATATAVLHPTTHGTRVSLTATRLPATRTPQVYELWFVNAAGRVSAGTFTTDGRPTTIHLSTAARPGTYQRIGITKEPDGIDPARNGPNLVAGRLPS